jgi:putative DNA primase/helicase
VQRLGRSQLPAKLACDRQRHGRRGALFNDSLLALDEISECDPREVGAIVYALGNGRGKQRASRTGSARAVSRWRCSVLSSGERTIGTTMAEGGHRIKAGQSVRLLDVPAQRTYGAWDNLHQHASGTAFSDALKLASVTHYGHAGRMFLERLTRDHEASFSEALDAIKAMPEFQASRRRRARKARRSTVRGPWAGWRVGNRVRRDRLAAR